MVHGQYLAWLGPGIIAAGVIPVLVIREAFLAFSKRRRAESQPNANFYLGDAAEAPACDGGARAGMWRHTSFGLGKNARSAHSASRRARRCDGVRCTFGTVTVIFPWLTVLMALRASGVQ
jgi:hypothetical protein